VVAVICRAVAFEQHADRRNVFIGQLASAAEIGSQERVFLGDPADTEAENQTPAAEMMNRGGLFCDEQRIALWKHEDPGAEPDGFSPGSQVAERCERLEEVAKRLGKIRRDQDVIIRPERRVAELFCFLGDRDHRHAVTEAAVVRQVQTEDHGRRPLTGPREPVACRASAGLRCRAATQPRRSARSTQRRDPRPCVRPPPRRHRAAPAVDQVVLHRRRRLPQQDR